MKRIIAFGVLGVLVIGGTVFFATKSYWVRFNEPETSGSPPVVRLISEEQYVNSLAYYFGRDVDIPARFARVQRIQGLLALGRAQAIVTPGALDQFDRAARSVAKQVVAEGRRAFLVPCTPASDTRSDEKCAKAFFSKAGRYLFRRPLTEKELHRYIDMAGHGAELTGDFYSGLGHSLAAMLISPKFLYIVESTEPDPDNLGESRLDGYSKASRLSLFFWNALPDEELLTAAETGDLHTKHGLNRQIDRMLASNRLRDGVRSFFADTLHFDEFLVLAKDPVIYPSFTQDLIADAREQTLRTIVELLVTQQGDYRDLFTAGSTFMNGSLAMLYQLPIDRPQGWNEYEFEETEKRAGLLTDLSFLALHSHPGRTSPTLRGKAIRELFLCQKVPEPPPNVSFEIVEDPNANFRTTRDRLDAHSSDPVCAGCHKLTDPMGLALENFDGVGRFRDRENEVVIDTSGQLDGVRFSDAVGLGKAMHDNPRVGSCFVSRLYAAGIGREVDRGDREWLGYIVNRFSSHDYNFMELLREIATSKAFFKVTEPEKGASMTMGSLSTLQPTGEKS